MKSNKIIPLSDNLKISNNNLNKNNSSFLENEISIINKKIKRKFNIYNKLYKNHKVDLFQTINEYKIENNKYKKINNKINILENELESIHKMISKVKKKKIYSISSIIKYKKLYNQSIFEKYKFLLNIGLNGPKDSYENLEIIKESDEEFNYYLNFLEKYYKSLEKENKIEYNYIKTIVNDLINDEDISFPEDKLLFYLSYIFQLIYLENELNIKKNELKNEEINKIEINTKIKKLETLKNEKENLVVNTNNSIELLKSLIQKYESYQKKYRNNLISKETLYNRLRKLQSIDLKNFQIENDNDISENSNFIMNESLKSGLPQKNKNLKLVSDRTNKISYPKNIQSRSQNISRNLSVDYLPQVEGPLTKKNNFEKNEICLNDIFFSMSNFDNNDSDKENVSEKSENESPVSSINISSRKKSLTNFQISNKTTKQNQKFENKNPISEFSINNYNYRSKNMEIGKNESNNIYCKKKPNLKVSMKSKIWKTKTNIIFSDNAQVFSNKTSIFVNNKNLKSPKKEKINKNKKNLLFLQKANKNKKHFINKINIFNNNLSKTISLGQIKLNLLSNDEMDKNKTIDNKLNKHILKSYINKCDITSFKNSKSGIFNNNKVTHKINIYEEINQKKFDDSIQTFKDEMKQKKYSYLNKNKFRKNLFFRTTEIQNDIPTENCCISCI